MTVTPGDLSIAAQTADLRSIPSVSRVASGPVDCTDVYFVNTEISEAWQAVAVTGGTDIG